jgi:hypothetical protein
MTKYVLYLESDVIAFVEKNDKKAIAKAKKLVKASRQKGRFDLERIVNAATAVKVAVVAN